MKIRSLKEIGKIFKEFGERIENGTCGTDPETLQQIASMMLHIKLNIEDVCKYINCSRATLNRMVADGRIPYPHKESGGKEYWYRDEIDDYIDLHKKSNILK